MLLNASHVKQGKLNKLTNYSTVQWMQRLHDVGKWREGRNLEHCSAVESDVDTYPALPALLDGYPADIKIRIPNPPPPRPPRPPWPPPKKTTRPYCIMSQWSMAPGAEMRAQCELETRSQGPPACPRQM